MSQDNGRVTMAVLGERLDQVLRRLDKIDETQQRIVDAQVVAATNYTACHTMQEQRWSQHKDEHADINVKRWAADIIGPAIAALLVWLGKTP